jgi:hypothetical protein
VKLFLSGTTGFDPKGSAPQVAKVKAFLDRSKDGELFTSEHLLERLKVPIGSSGRLFKALGSYTHKIGSKRYWGKPSTIKQLIKETK